MKRLIVVTLFVMFFVVTLFVLFFVAVSPVAAARVSNPQGPWYKQAVSTVYNYGSYYYTKAYNYATGLNGQSARNSVNQWGSYRWVQTVYNVINYQW